jgi:CheY-like chemotaxis protein
MQTVYQASNYFYPSFASQIDYDEINATVERIESNGSVIKAFKRPPKVLLIEDTPIIQRINLVYLKLLGCKVELAQNGEQAIDMFSNGYDLVLSDIGLPDIDGREVIKIIRQQEQSKRTPIIALTAFDDFIIKECLEAGVDDFYVKPLKTKELSAMLKRWLPEFV